MRRLFQLFFVSLSLLLLSVRVFGSEPDDKSSNERSYRAIPDDNLMYPVLISVPGGSPWCPKGSQGSGFFLRLKDSLHLVTARHVIFSQDKPEKLCGPKAVSISYGDKKSGDLDVKTVFNIDLTVAKQTGEMLERRAADLVILPIATKDDFLSDGSHRTRSYVSIKEGGHTLSVSVENVYKLEDVLVGNDIFIFGYPSAIGLRENSQIDYSRALLRKGIVAGINRRRRTIILDVASYGGNSGGPVLQAERRGLGAQFRVIGFIVQSVPFESTVVKRVDEIGAVRNLSEAEEEERHRDLDNSGYSVAVPMDEVLRLLEENGFDVGNDASSPGDTEG